MVKKYNVAVVGATGLVGQKIIDVLLEREFPFADLRLLASSRSADRRVKIKDCYYTVEELTADSFTGINYAFFSAGESISHEFAPEAVKRGTVVIDNSNAFRMETDIPLVVPEVNPDMVFEHQGIIANPNCSTIQMVVALQPLQKASAIKRVVAATYQAVSGAGREAVEELHEQCRAILDNRPVKAERIPYKGASYPYQIAYNVVPQIDVFVEDGYCKEERKMVQETRKIMGLPGLRLTATTVRVPVVKGHAIALNVEFANPLTPDEARDLLAAAPGVKVIDDPVALAYPTPLQAEEDDTVFVGRIRKDHSIENGLHLWVVSDNIRKGAATNSIQIAELLLKN
ncbi:MAG: aspartate-semialdehyde dehydrogenase [Bacillota bacterium]